MSADQSSFSIGGRTIVSAATLFVRGAACLALFFAAIAILASPVFSAPPVYQLQLLGNGSPVAINSSGTVAGARLSGNNYSPLVSVNGAVWATLPVPAGAMSCFPTDINDSGVIVGVSFDTSWNPTAVRWVAGKGGNYVVEAIPRLAGHTSSYALGINNLGQIVGSRSSLGYSPTGTGWLYSDALGAVDLTTFNFWVYPRAINDSTIIIGGQERLNFATGQVDVIGAGPTNYNPVGGVAINNSGQIAGTASLRSTSLNIVSLFRYDAGVWQYITGTSRYTTASSINNLGDIGFGELGAGIYYNNDTFYAVGELLDPVLRNQGWTITGTGVFVNDQRAIATLGRNSVTGESGAVLLTPSGLLPPPSAPANLAGVAHPATRMEPFNSINLSWENTSPQTQSYDLQRRETSSPDWVTLSLIPPGSGITHIDATVGVNITYEYRVRAVGVAGPGPWSGSVFVTSPATPLDTTPPVVSILSPSDGANVSGIVPVSAQAADDVAVEYFEVSFWNQFAGQEVMIGSMTSAGTLNVNWDTRNLTPAAYRLRAYAYDTLGNWTTRDINVNVGGTTTNLLRVASIALSASGRNTVVVNGRVNIRDGFGETVRGATVTAEWTLPNGQTQIQTAVTSANGNAGFSTESRRGTYTLRIVSVSKAGYAFDIANSVTTRSITR